jgi:hypothetical protein
MFCRWILWSLLLADIITPRIYDLHFASNRYHTSVSRAPTNIPLVINPFFEEALGGQAYSQYAYNGEFLFHRELMQLLSDQSLDYGAALSPDIRSGEAGDLTEVLSTDNSR